MKKVLFLSFFLALLGLFYPHVSFGQNKEWSKNSSKKNNLKIPNDLEGIRLFQKAESFKKQKEYTKVIQIYMKILQEDDHSVFAVGKGKYEGIYHFILKKIKSFSIEEIHVFRKLYGQKAKILYHQIIKQGIWKSETLLQRLGEVYFPTEPAIKANLILAGMLVEKGQFQEALHHYKALLSLKILGKSLEKMVLLKAMMVLKNLVVFNKNEQILLLQIYHKIQKFPSLKRRKTPLDLILYFQKHLEVLLEFKITYRYLNTPIRVQILQRTENGIQIQYNSKQLFLSKKDILKITAPTFNKNLQKNKIVYNIQENYTVVGGNNSHNSRSAFACKIGVSLVASAPIISKAIQKNTRRVYRYDFRSRSYKEIFSGDKVYPFYPMMYKNWLYVTTPTRLIGYAMDGSKEKFSVMPNSNFTREENPEMLYAPLIYKNRIYSTFITNPNYISSEKFGRVDIKKAIPLRRLSCFDRFTGKKIWEKTGKMDPFFKDVSIPLSPIVRDGKLYCVGLRFKGYIQTFIIALDAKTGKSLWKRWVSSGSVSTTMFGFYAREPLCSILAESNGVLYCSTNQGVIVALTAQKGRLLWMQKYSTIEIQAARFFNSSKRKIQWANNPPILSKDWLCIAPMDSSYFYVLNRHTGKIKWKKARNESNKNLVYILGVWKNVLLLSGKWVVAYELSSGKIRWDNYLIDASPKGRGMICQNNLLVPVRTFSNAKLNRKAKERLLVFNLEKGYLTQYIDFPSGISAGNLVVTKKYILTASDRKVSICQNNYNESGSIK